MKSRKPAWWQLYLVIPVVIGLGLSEELTPLPGVSREIVFAAIIALMFSAMFAWVQFNRGRLEWYEMERTGTVDDLRITVFNPKSARADQNSGEVIRSPMLRPVLRVPARPTQETDNEKW
ncbi:MAG: hypothetical protein HY868_15430 [Chloroflexi bacterium]|nr:hypothetical protein [Chloroflexota bacterium]